MKRTKIFTCLMMAAFFALAAPDAGAQFFARFYGGYALGFDANDGSVTNEITYPNGFTEIEAVPARLASGISFGGAVGFDFGNFGAELGADYFIGSELTQTEESPTLGLNYLQNYYGLNLKPAVSLRINPDKTLTPYARLGLILAFMQRDNETEGVQDGSSVYIKGETTHDMGFGLDVGCGAEYKVNDLISIFAELNLQSLALTAAEFEITEYTIDGQNQLGNLNVNQREIELVDSYSQLGSPNPNLPSKQIAYNVNMSSVGLNLGLKLNF